MYQQKTFQHWIHILISVVSLFPLFFILLLSSHKHSSSFYDFHFWNIAHLCSAPAAQPYLASLTHLSCAPLLPQAFKTHWPSRISLSHGLIIHMCVCICVWECVGKYSESTGCYQVLSHLAAVHHPINSEKGYHTQEGTGAWRESKVVTTTLQSPAYPVLFNSEETNLVELEALLSHRVWHVLLRQTVMVTKTLTNALVKIILEIFREYFCILRWLLQHSVTTHTDVRNPKL